MRDAKPKSDTKKSPFGYVLYRYSIAFSALLALLSVVSDFGSRIANRIWVVRHDQVASAELKKALQPYEAPSFHLFDGTFVRDAKAMSR